MTLELNLNCQDRLVKSLTDQLRDVRIVNGIFLDIDSIMHILDSEKILPQTGRQKELLNKYIAEKPLFGFVLETISRDIYENETYDSERAVTPLTGLHRYADPNASAQRLIDELNSLPWKYIVSFELNVAFGKMLRACASGCPISDNIRLVAPDASYDQTFPLLSGVKARDKNLFAGNPWLSLLPGNKWNQETSYLQLDCEGFIGMNNKTTPIEDATSTLKAFFGLCLAVNLLRARRAKGILDLLLGSTVRSYLVVHRRENDRWGVWATFELPRDISATLNNFEVDDLDGQVDASRIGEMIRNRLQLISCAFRNELKAENVLLASQWLLDSYVGGNELLSFVQLTVAMEILLGECAKSEAIGIGELLRNRCAYMIGKSHSQREEILNDFKKIYEVRSNIVHRGKNRLSLEELSLFRVLQWTCQRVITEELKLLFEDKNKKETT